ncbi:MAG: ATP-dependent DNA helicase [Acidimicrobiales bacterium]|nr:ATP-dependent DNA helicase [Acidimicrobiales bacterium]MCB1260134.1 ATP-dependent DNA helicase [Acidimicrobiales bacterium]
MTSAAARRAVDALVAVAAGLPTGEDRPGQRDMAAAVADAIERDRHLIVAAGTGTGKSLAYLVPAILSGKRVVVATATKALQDQLAGKDLPLLAETLDVPFSFAVLKGRSNYICRQRLREQAVDADQLRLAGVDSPGVAEEVRALAAFADTSTTGDRAELDAEPSPRAWAAVSVTSEECPGRTRCPSGDACFAEAARDKAASSDVIVVNSHLYGVHLASMGVVLPDHDVLVVDEAHRLEDTVSATCGLELTAGRIHHVARALRAVLADAEVPDAVEEVADRLEQALEPDVGRRLRRGLPRPMAEVVALLRSRLATALEVLRKIDQTSSPEVAARTQRAMQLVTTLVEDCDGLAAIPEDRVAWVEGPEDRPSLQVAPIDVAPVLRTALFATTPTVLTSATVPAGLAETLGMPADRTDELDVGSPFDYEANALLYCAAHLPDPRSEAFEAAARDELAALIEAAGGRTLALFTSYRAMRAAAADLRERVTHPILTQDDLPQARLVEAFAADEATCLFATMRFWQGIDVPGPSLSLVTIDKIPFPRPDEPLLQARREQAREAAFRTVDLPRATTLLAQGAGRLVRSATDTGVVAVLDPRLATAPSYRWEMVRALPPMRRTRDRAEALAALAAIAGPSA